MAVGADCVEVVEVGEGKLAAAQFDAAHGDSGGECKGTGLLIGGCFSEADCLVDLVAGGVGNCAQVWIADDVKIGEAGEAQCFTKAAATGALKVKDEIGVIADRGGWDGLRRRWCRPSRLCIQMSYESYWCLDKWSGRRGGPGR